MSGAPRDSIALGAGDEFDAIRDMLRIWGAQATGIGDDAAIVDVPQGQRLVVSTDASVEHIHFRRGWLSPSEIGARATAAALSDLAAMAARPLGLLLALGVPDAWRRELEVIARGVGAQAAQADCPIVGGNVTRASELSLTITVLGSAARPLARSQVRPGDLLYVTGVLGGPGAALRALLAGSAPLPAHGARFTAPTPRLSEARWLAAAGARAAIDLSDGLASDAGHLAAASHVRIELELGAIPLIDGVSSEEAVASGEEYELLVAFAPETVPDVARFADEFGIGLRAVGRAVEGSGVALLREGRPTDIPRGHDHFS